MTDISIPGVGVDIPIPGITVTPPEQLSALSFGAMQARVYAVVKDADKSFLTPENVKDWLNEGATEIAVRTKIIRRQHTQTEDGIVTAGLVPLPSDYLETFSLHVAGVEVQMVDDAVFNSYADVGADPGTTLGRVFGPSIETYPASKVGATLSHRYAAVPVPMGADTDVCELPVQLHAKVVNFARFHALLKDQDPKNQEYYSLYVEGLPPMPNARERLIPGPITIGIEPGPFDVWDC